LSRAVAAVALRGVDGVLPAHEGDVAPVEANGHGQFVIVGNMPELGGGDAVAAKVPLGEDEDIDRGALGGSGGGEALVVLGGEFGERFGGLRGKTLGLGVDAALPCLEARDGLAHSGASSGGVLRVAAGWPRSGVG
jgi:hypothetical protein